LDQIGGADQVLCLDREVTVGLVSIRVGHAVCLKGVQGYIEFEEDRDWYGIEISGNQDILVEMWTDTASPVEFIWFMYQPESSMVYASAGDNDEIDESPVSFITGDDEVFWVDEDHSGFYLFKLSDYNRNDWDLTVLYHFRVTLSPH